MNARALPRMLKNALCRTVPVAVLTCLKPYKAHVYAAKNWNKEYASGQWDYLEQVGEVARYSVMAGYCSFFKGRGAILDIGCGTGVLMRRLREIGYGSYLGVDLSGEAIRRAKADEDETTRFEVADAATFVPNQDYDAIIFNEILYYLPEPRGILRRYANHLRPNGIMIVSMHRAANSLRTWRLLKSVAPIRDAVSLTNTTSRLSWDIKVYACAG